MQGGEIEIDVEKMDELDNAMDDAMDDGEMDVDEVDDYTAEVAWAGVGPFCLLQALPNSLWEHSLLDSMLCLSDQPCCVHQECPLAEAANAEGDAATAPKAPPKPHRQVGSGQAHAIARDYTRDLVFYNYKWAPAV